MRGPSDQLIEAGETAGPPAPGVPEVAPALRPREVPGGKALLRLLTLLDSAGLTQLGSQILQGVVQGTAVPDAADKITQLTTGLPPGTSGIPQGGVAAPGHPGGEASVGTAFLDAVVQLGPPTGVGPQWESLGPWTVPNGQTYGASRVNVSGRVSSIAVDPSDGAHVLVGAANGGVWESRDRGASWAPRSDYAGTTAIGAIAFDRRNPTTVYCGTGEGNWWSWLGVGILRSTDGGRTWSQHCTNPFVGQGFYDLIVDPGDGMHLLAATTGGLYVSTDGGSTWTRRRTAITWSLSMHPTGGATAEILAASSDGLFASTNGGTNWTAVTLPGSPAAFSRLAVALAPSNPTIAYAWGASGSTAYLWRRSGGIWTAITTPTGVSINQAWYDWYLAVAPDRDSQIYCGAIDSHRGDLSGTTWTWTNLSSKPAGGESIHPDQHAIAFEPGNPNMIYIGNDGGLFRSPNRGVNWVHCNNGLVITEFEYHAQSLGTSRWLIGGTQDNGTERWTGSPIWDHIADGDGGDCGVNRTNPQTVFHTYYGMSPERSTSGGDFGSWTWIAPSLPAGEGSPFYPPFECSAGGGDTIAMAGVALYVSRDNGANWTRVAFPSAASATAMFIPNTNAVYVGVSDGRILRTTWSGSAWSGFTTLTTPRTGAFASDLQVDTANTNSIWATYRTMNGGRVFQSTDGGTTWTDRTAGLPNLPINAIEVDTANPSRIWVAADLGVYESRDSGASWTGFSNGLPNAYVGDLVFHPYARVLRAGTRNRGAWQIPVDGWQTQPVCSVQWIGSLAANQTARWFTFNWPATWHMIWTVMPTSFALGAPELTWKVEVERADSEHVTYWISVTNLTSAPVTFEGRYCILSRY
jgi:hypothetical protein